MKSNHKPGCLIGAYCAVAHPNGLCSGLCGTCTCAGSIDPRFKDSHKPCGGTCEACKMREPQKEKEPPEGTTHHAKDACYKCGICGDHFFTEDKAKNCNHDYSIAKNLINKPIPPNAQRTGDEGRVEKKENNWEEEFDIMWRMNFITNHKFSESEISKTKKDRLKSFISTQIEKVRIEARKDLLAQLDEK